MLRVLLCMTSTDAWHGASAVDKAEVNDVGHRMQKEFPQIVLNPPFDLDTDYGPRPVVALPCRLGTAVGLHI
jgi:hypothetical protein